MSLGCHGGSSSKLFSQGAPHDASITLSLTCCCTCWSQVSSQEYELWLSPDSSTTGHTQWYFFSIANGKTGVQYQLHIHNFRKAHSLYSQGLQPLLHSTVEAEQTVSPSAHASQHSIWFTAKCAGNCKKQCIANMYTRSYTSEASWVSRGMRMG